MMQVWNYIEILRGKKNNWLSPKISIEEKLDALAKIHEIGSPRDISSLVPFLKDKHHEIQMATCDVILSMFNNLESKKGYYETLKYCPIAKSDLDLYEATFSKEQHVNLLAIASLNGSGYVREEAVRKLSNSADPNAIQFIIYRLADWVEPVRKVALQGLNAFKTSAYLDAFIDNLLIFEWLRKVERIDLSKVYQDIISFIVKENKDYVFQKFSFYPERARLLLAKHMSGSEITDLTLTKLFLQDKHFLIRNLVIDHFDKLTQAEIDTLLRDKSAKVRLHVLHKLQSKSSFFDIVPGYLADNSASVREFSRFWLKGKASDFPAIYYENLLNNRKLIGSLFGLAEINAKQFSNTVESFLLHKKVSIRKAAFMSLKKLDEEKAFNFALKNLDSEIEGIRNVVIDFLSIYSTGEVLEKARVAYKNGNYEIKKSMLNLFHKTGSWKVLADIILGTIDANEDIRNSSIQYLKIWKTQAVRLFTQPKADELERARQMFNFVVEMHDDKRYFKENPLTGLEFYIK